MMKVLLLLIALPALAQAAPAVQVTATFRAQINEKTWYEITPRKKDSKLWQLKEIKACESFPCSPDEQKGLLFQFRPTLISDQRARDGELRIRLTPSITLVKRDFGLGRPAQGPQTPYVLEIKAAGETKLFPVSRLEDFYFGG